MYIVAEYLYIENLIINFIILQITKSITKTKISNKRMIIGSMVLALYPFVMFFPALDFLTNFFIKIIISVIAIKLVFNAKSTKLYIKQLSGFYVVSFIFAGASLGIYFFTMDYNKYFFSHTGGLKIFPVKYLIMGIILGGIMLKNIIHYYQMKVLRERELLDIIIHFQDQDISITSLLDTGNSLVEPLSRLPVFVVEYKIIQNMLPDCLKKVFESNMENDYIALEKVMNELKDIMNINLIPFKSLGMKNGFIIGFKPDSITIYNGIKKNTYENLIIGIYNGKLSNDEGYYGLLNLEILNKGEFQGVS